MVAAYAHFVPTALPFLRGRCCAFTTEWLPASRSRNCPLPAINNLEPLELAPAFADACKYGTAGRIIRELGASCV